MVLGIIFKNKIGKYIIKYGVRAANDLKDIIKNIRKSGLGSG
jgi:hypothetical protein